ncbi:MAG: hypothetical protein DCC71_21205 [Proteobacteria bacterium]|nr:MAG: hypothetical protein DCC71_21205 [Pseudomonadota bacterium]
MLRNRRGRRRAAAVAQRGVARVAGPAAKLAPLTSLRFFAAAAIVVHHLRGSFGIPREFGLPFLFDQAVSFFFVLSGFILAYVYGELADARERRRFLRARFARIWPAHAAAFAIGWLLLGAAFAPQRGASLLGHAALNLAMVHAWLPFQPVFFSFNAVSWSISTEFGFYLLFPLLAFRLRATWWWKLALAAGAVLALAGVAAALALPAKSVDAWSVTAPGLVYVHPLARVFEFVLGMCCTLAFPRLAARLHGRRALATALELAALAALLWITHEAAGIAHRAVRDGWTSEPLGIWLVHGGLACPAFAAVVLVFACQGGALSRVLSLPALQLLGEISFSLYLLHQIAIRWYELHRTAFDGVPHALQLAVFAVAILLLSHLVWSCVERPLRDRIAGRHGQRARPSRRALAELALFAALAGAVGFLAQRPAPAPAADAQELAARRARTPESVRDARFGDARILRAVTVERGADELRVALAWEPLGGAAADTLVAVHAVDAAGRIVAQADYRDADAGARGAVRVAERRIALPAATAVQHVAIALVPPGGAPLAVDRGARDWSGRRLLVPIP